jgi:long-chain fatty acid transport protein
MKKQFSAVAGALLLSGGFAMNSWAVGGASLANEVLSARSAGQGYVAIAGQNDDPTTVYSNPAGITKLLGTQVTLGAHWESIHPTYDADSGDRTRARPSNVIVPNFALTQSFADGQWGAGVAVESPFGLETHWGATSPLRYVATDTRLRTIIVTPAVAYKPISAFSVGVGLDYFNVPDAQLDRHVNVDLLNQGLGLGTTEGQDAVSSLRGDGSAWGYHAGVLVQPNDWNALGVTYHSKAKIRVDGTESISGLYGQSTTPFGFGTSNYQTSAYTDLTLPQSVQLGYAIKPGLPWTWEIDAAWLHWSEQRDLNVRYAETNPLRSQLLNVGNPEVLQLHDTWNVASGFNFKYSDYWQFRGGVFYEPHATPETYFSPAFMDLSRYGASVGAGWNITKYFVLDMAYTAVFFHNRDIHNNLGAGSIDGTYKNFASLLALNLTYRFGQKE